MIYPSKVVNHIRKVTTTWKRIISLFWKLSPTSIVVLSVVTVITGIVPSLQVQLTIAIVQSAANAIQHNRLPQLLTVAVMFTLAQAGLSLLVTLLSSLQYFLESLLQVRLANSIGLRIMEKAVTLGLRYYEDSQVNDQLQRAIRESSYRPYQIFTQMISTASQVVSLISIAITLFFWNWWLGLLLLLTPIPSLASQMYFSQKGYQLERERSTARRRLFYHQYLVTTAQTFKEILLFRLTSHFVKQYRVMTEQFYLVDRKLYIRQALSVLPFNILSICVLAGAYVFVVLAAIGKGAIGQIAGYIQAINLMQESADRLLDSLNSLYQSNLFISNLFEFLDMPKDRIRSGTYSFPNPLREGIEFCQVSFYYPGTDKKVLDNISFRLPAGQCVALVGQNGAGKTTIIKLLTRLYEPTEGRILIDGVPIEEYDIESLRHHIGVIFQDFIRYEMTVRENIGFGKVERLDDVVNIQQAAQQSGAALTIERLPNAYNALLGRMFEQGEELSLGQWQKIALARAFMRQAPLLILDEPTAAIDAEAEMELFGRLRQIASNATTLLIAHRFSTVRIADHIVVLKQGRVIEQGTHESLLANCGTYAHLFQLQAAGYQ